MSSARLCAGPQPSRPTPVPSQFSHHETYNFDAMSQQEFEAIQMERYRQRMGIALGKCDCFCCNPKLYSMPEHGLYPDRAQADSLEWRSHDPMRLAEIIVKARSQEQTTKKTLDAQEKWLYWRLYYRLGEGPRPNIPAQLNTRALPQVIDCLSDMFFKGMLPSSNLVCLWRNFSPEDRQKFGVTIPPHHAGGITQILLNQCQPQLVHSLEETVRVILHEMIHAFFIRHGCSSRLNGRQCEWGPTGLCSKFWYANLGLTGHGRAWSCIARSIEGNMRRKLGIAGHLGRDYAFGLELTNFNALPCKPEIRILYPWARSWKLFPDMRHHIKAIREGSRAAFFARPTQRRRHSDSVICYSGGPRQFRETSTAVSSL